MGEIRFGFSCSPAGFVNRFPLLPDRRGDAGTRRGGGGKGGLCLRLWFCLPLRSVVTGKPGLAPEPGGGLRRGGGGVRTDGQMDTCTIVQPVTSLLNFAGLALGFMRRKGVRMVIGLIPRVLARF
ncbi:unnamed protein product [Cuscuta europaea]|uniref:Uncharacterized protein n=1 Tax=Cuscuta europaea TaxID=41803 RepID=A0A9P0ZRU9_CUSEU|nr:unnamed protein product [Cuscuta europaea]